MKDVIDVLNTNTNPMVIIIGLLLLYAVKDLSEKIGKINKIDDLVKSIKDLTEKIGTLIDKQSIHEEKTAKRIRELEVVINKMNHRLIVLENTNEQRGE